MYIYIYIFLCIYLYLSLSDHIYVYMHCLFCCTLLYIISVVTFSNKKHKEETDVQSIELILLRIYNIPLLAMLLNFILMQPCLELVRVVGVILTEHHISNDAHVAQG